MKAEDLKPGDWILRPGAGLVNKFYVLETFKSYIAIGNHELCVSHAHIKKYSELGEFEYIGRGKLRWWWKYLPWRDLITPYTEPVRKDNERNHL